MIWQNQGKDSCLSENYYVFHKNYRFLKKPLNIMVEFQSEILIFKNVQEGAEFESILLKDQIK